MQFVAKLTTSILLIVVLAAGCDCGGAAVEDAGAKTDAASPCRPGQVDCECLPGAQCASSDLYCGNGICRQPVCRIGDLACACSENYTCNQAEDGEWLLCQAGLCRRAPCQQGSIGCDCGEGDSCGDGLHCVNIDGDKRCELDGCTVGDLGCGCYPERSCNPDPAGVTLACEDGICIRPNCTPGTESCLCRSNYSCDDGLICQDGTRCETLRCQPGSANCECQPGGYCNLTTLACDAVTGLCQAQDCEPGSKDCTCTSDKLCSVDANGAALVCIAGMCVAPSCSPGSLGCSCTAQATCLDTQSECDDGWCVRSNCSSGSANCACASAQSCADGLICINDDICIDDMGYNGGACFANRTCRDGNRCQNGLCVACVPGSLACACGDNGCGFGLSCYAGTCVAQSALARSKPREPKCYTPCHSDLKRADDSIARCDADGLLEGCIGDNICREGSCVAPSASTIALLPGIPFCASDVDCPDYQACIEGHCYSECDLDSDCAVGLACQRKVCRVPCQSTGAACPTGTYCELDSSGVTGFCTALGSALLPSSNSVAGSFSLSSISVDFSPIKTTSTLRIYNTDSQAHQFRIARKYHGTYDANNEPTAQVDEFRKQCDWSTADASQCPLTWLSLDSSVSGTVDDGDLTFTLHGSCSAQSACQVDSDCPSHMSCLDDLCFCDDASCGADWACTAFVDISDVENGPAEASRWSGLLEVGADNLGAQRVALSYRQTKAGQWQGSMYYFANFGDRNLDQWLNSDHSQLSLLENTENAFIKRWVQYRMGTAGNVTHAEFEAVIRSTIDETWNWPSVRNACIEQHGVEDCYLTQNGPVIYSDDPISKPIPSGIVQLPFVLNLRPASTSTTALEGKISSSQTLQYIGDPSVYLSFADSPGVCTASSRPDACLSMITHMGARSTRVDGGVDIRVGGRYVSNELDRRCSARHAFAQKETPWLIPGFVPPGFEYSTAAERAAAPAYSYECRDTLLPFFSSDAAQMMSNAPFNTTMSAANPIADGRTRRRQLELVDGFMINGESMFLLLRESFELVISPTATRVFDGYALVVLARTPVTLSSADANNNGIADAFDGSDYSAETRSEPSDDILAQTCSDSLLRSIPGVTTLDENNADAIATILIDGVAPSSSATVVYPRTSYNGNWYVHYFCEDTGRFDGGGFDDGTINMPYPINDDSCAQTTVDGIVRGAINGICEDGGLGSLAQSCILGTDKTDCGIRFKDDLREPCPAGSRVVYFLLDNSNGAHDQHWLSQRECQHGTGSCWGNLQSWVANGTVQLDPLWTCESSTSVLCSSNRADLREGKKFYLPGSDAAVFRPLAMEIDDAYRYRTRFVSRGGSSLGFAPEVCDPISDSIPYCYDPARIEAVQQRVDCLLAIHQNHFGDLVVANRNKLTKYLSSAMAHDANNNRDGFEKLDAELLIMLGDESFTKAFASRYDMAETQTRSFEGTQFEPGGINLSGGAGNEMHHLYLATQYYQRVLDRFMSLSPALWRSLDYGAARQIVTQETVSMYLVKIARASTQKARAFSEIAVRYQNFNRADLARGVVERAYTATFMESVIIGRMMDAIMDKLAPEDKPQVASIKQDVARRYRVALADMRNVYNQITDDITYFGFAPDYVPFPALDNVFLSNNAFEVLQSSAAEKVALAGEREQTALSSNRDFETDTQAFQRELATIRANYNTQLGDLCGTFVGADGAVYPAVNLYADRAEATKLLGDPCGLVGNGELHESMGDLDLKLMDLKSVIVSQETQIERIRIEMQRVADYCGEVRETVDFEYKQRGAMIALNTLISTIEKSLTIARSIYDMTRDAASVTVCNVGTSNSCQAAPIAATTIGAAGGVLLTAEMVGGGAIIAMQEGIEGIERATARFVGMQQCDYAQVDSRATVMNMVLDLQAREVDRLRAEYEIQLALSRVSQLRNKSQSTLGELLEQEQLLINVEAARNDPNVRIYRNDAIINADIAFKDALAEVYKLTKVYEYYTSMSYAAREKLFLVRMVRAGDFNLENYLIELGNGFADFSEQYGGPDTRVAVYSLRDDVLNIPRLGSDQRPLTMDQRIGLLRQTLTNGSLLNPRGYIVAPFSTSFRRLSPLTRNHKILSMQAEFSGSGVGDDVARVYVRQKGTSTVHALDDSHAYFQFDQRTAVLNTFMNGQRDTFDSSVYSSYRLRDRPFVNSSWELIFNQQDEFENLDVDLNAVDDVRVFIYYTDFTQY